MAQEALQVRGDDTDTEQAAALPSIGRSTVARTGVKACGIVALSLAIAGAVTWLGSPRFGRVWSQSLGGPSAGVISAAQAKPMCHKCYPRACHFTEPNVFKGCPDFAPWYNVHKNVCANTCDAGAKLKSGSTIYHPVYHRLKPKLMSADLNNPQNATKNSSSTVGARHRHHHPHPQTPSLRPRRKEANATNASSTDAADGEDRPPVCEVDTGRTCRVFDCDRESNERCSLASRCLCRPGFCTNRAGRCVPDPSASAPPRDRGHCKAEVGTSCKLFSCDGEGNQVCGEAKKCVCRPGFCAEGGVCVALAPRTPKAGGAAVRGGRPEEELEEEG